MLSLEDKIIVVTGGSGLLGQIIVDYLKNSNAIVISVDIHQKKVDSHNRLTDLTDALQVAQVIKDIVKDFGCIDGWVNNAYPRTADWGTKFEHIPVESWRKNVDMHMNSYFICCQYVLEQMKTQGSGAVINMSSIYGTVGPDFTVYEGTDMTMPAAYSAIKGGIVNLTRYLASYYGKHNITVNCVSPGGIFDNQNPIFVENYEKKVPMKRMGASTDIAPSVAFLLSDGARYITGHNLIIDGGWSAI